MQQYLPFTVLKLYQYKQLSLNTQLQQYLPFTVLKLGSNFFTTTFDNDMLQQYLPFTVLKLVIAGVIFMVISLVATVLTVYGIETHQGYWTLTNKTSFLLQQYLPFTVLKLLFENFHDWFISVATVLTVYGIET